MCALYDPVICTHKERAEVACCLGGAGGCLSRGVASSCSCLATAGRKIGALCCSGAPWADNASTEWLNSVLLELYRHGKLPVKPSDASQAPIGGRQGADRSVERSNDASSDH